MYNPTLQCCTEVKLLFVILGKFFLLLPLACSYTFVSLHPDFSKAFVYGNGLFTAL